MSTRREKLEAECEQRLAKLERRGRPLLASLGPEARVFERIPSFGAAGGLVKAWQLRSPDHSVTVSCDETQADEFDALIVVTESGEVYLKPEMGVAYWTIAQIVGISFTRPAKQNKKLDLSADGTYSLVPIHEPYDKNYAHGELRTSYCAPPLDSIPPAPISKQLSDGARKYLKYELIRIVQELNPSQLVLEPLPLEEAAKA